MLRVRGIVQGVGFRPFVHRIASRLELRGWVRNDPQGVLIVAVGESVAVSELLRTLDEEAPPAAQVTSIETLPSEGMPAVPATGFMILESAAAGATEAGVPPDLAMCGDCRAELLDPINRRFRYPFINCTQCGPRYSILRCLPYDRRSTTMAVFSMCPHCADEYANPASRRFHAQPNACPVCGPEVIFAQDSGKIRGEAALDRAQMVLATGGILAVKGIGGYHLMTDATNELSVRELRHRKQRDEKPFAVMFADLAAAAREVHYTAEEADLLQSPAAPIVLLLRRRESHLASAIAPRNPWIGTILAHTPLQVLMLRTFGRPVVATSGNLSEEPLCTSADEATRRLAGIADAFVHHSCPIEHPADDSVLKIAPRSGRISLRRGRGYAPAPFSLPEQMDGDWLCVGAQMKSTVGVATGNRLVLSPHLGDLTGPAGREVFHRAASVLKSIYGREWTAVVCDRHPDYASTRYAEQLGLPLLAVQHHLAHVLSCLLEHGKEADDVLGVAWDGTGLGEDGTIWGGEFLLLRQRKASRFARLRPFSLPGGDASARDARRTALGLAHTAGRDAFESVAHRLKFRPIDAAILRTMLDRGINSPVTSSMGRWLDAAGALLGLGDLNRYEGQIPLALEAAAFSAGDAREQYPFPLRAVAPGGGAVWEVDWEPCFNELRAAHGSATAESAAALHRGLAQAILVVAQKSQASTVVLSGGCFQNALLLDLASSALHQAGFAVLTHHQLPPNDGGIAAGQALGALWGLSSVELP